MFGAYPTKRGGTGVIQRGGEKWAGRMEREEGEGRDKGKGGRERKRRRKTGDRGRDRVVNLY